jgi:hypothetical protein
MGRDERVEIADAEEVEARREREDMKRRIEELERLVHEQAQRIEDLEEQQNNGDDHGYACDAEKTLRLDALGSLSTYEERVARIWQELPKHAQRNAVGDVTYSLDYNRLRDALASVDPDEWDSGEKVKSQQTAYAREAFEDITPASIETGAGGSKKVIVYARKWALDRPDEAARRLMSPKDADKFVDGGAE